MAAWYPEASSYFVAELDDERPIFQGDVFRGVPTAFVDHPESHMRVFAGEDPPTPAEAERPLTAAKIREVTAVKGGYTMVLRHPCDFAEAEKGSTHSVRIVARLDRVAAARLARRQVVRGAVHHAVWVPDWETLRPDDDYCLDLRTTTPVDRAYLNRARRVAALTGPAWLA